jgi:integrase
MPRNGLGLYRPKGTGYWLFKYRDPQSGKWRIKSTGQSQKQPAWKLKEQFLEQLQVGTLPNDMGNWTLQQAVDSWLEYRKATKSKGTWKVEGVFLRRVISIIGAGHVLKTLTVHDLQNYQVKRRAQIVKRSGEPVHPRTVNLELKALRQILDRADLWPRFVKYKPLRVPKSTVGRVLTEEPAKALIDNANSRADWFVAFHCTVLAHSTGCRGCEIKSLHLKNVILEGSVPMLRIEKSKTDAGVREIPLNATALWAAKKLVERAHALGGSDPEHHLLPLNMSKIVRHDDPRRGQRGYDFTQHQGSWRKAFSSLKKAAGIPAEFRFHDNRCSFITACAEAAVPIEVTRSLVGHLSDEMSRHYMHIATKAQEKAVKALEAEHALFGSAHNAPAPSPAM